MTVQLESLQQFQQHGPQGLLGVHGVFRCVKHDVHGMSGSGPNGEVQFEDLWEQNAKGKWVSKHPERVTQDETVKNKFTRRGLAYLMYTALIGQGGTPQSKEPPEILNNWGVNPFQAFVLLGDNAASTPSRPGDARVIWSESDNIQDNNVCGTYPTDAGNHYEGYGRRGLLLSDTTATQLKRVQIRYPGLVTSTWGYEELEYTFFAMANGTLMAAGDDHYIDNFVVHGLALAGNLTAGNSVQCGYGDTNSCVGIRAILGNLPTFQGVCDRAYVHECYSYGAAGAGSATAMHKYTGGDTITGNNDGWVCDSEASDTVLVDRTVAETCTFTASTRQIHVATAATFNVKTARNAATHVNYVPSTHLRKTFLITGSGSNPGPFTIKKVIDDQTIEVFEAVVDDNSPGSSCTYQIVTRNTGAKAFDGRVNNEGLSTTIKSATDQDPVQTVINGEKWVSTDAGGAHMLGRVFASAQQVSGIRVIFPAGSVRDFCPNRFQIQYLIPHGTYGSTTPASAGQGTSPNQWNTVTPTQGDPNATDQAANIFDNGVYGYEYTFPAPVTCAGIRLASLLPVDTTRKAEIAELQIFGQASSVAITTNSNDKLSLSIDGGSTYLTVAIPAVTMATGGSVQTLCDALNRVLYGWGLEAIRSTFGYLWIRGTVAGDNCQLISQALVNSAYAALGITAAPLTATGQTVWFIKAQADAATFIYTVKMAGNLAHP